MGLFWPILGQKGPFCCYPGYPGSRVFPVFPVFPCIPRSAGFAGTVYLWSFLIAFGAEAGGSRLEREYTEYTGIHGIHGIQARRAVIQYNKARRAVIQYNKARRAVSLLLVRPVGP